jgi:hypothetical protein
MVLGYASGGMVAVTVLTAMFTQPGSPQRLLVMALAAGVAVALMPDWRQGLLLALIGYLLYVGFLVNQEGELTWHGRHPWVEVGIFALTVSSGLLGRRLGR